MKNKIHSFYLLTFFPPVFLSCTLVHSPLFATTSLWCDFSTFIHSPSPFGYNPFTVMLQCLVYVFIFWWKIEYNTKRKSIKWKNGRKMLIISFLLNIFHHSLANPWNSLLQGLKHTSLTILIIIFNFMQMKFFFFFAFVLYGKFAF